MSNEEIILQIRSYLHAKTMQVVTTFLDKTSLAGAVSFPIVLSLSKFLGILSESF